MQKEKDGDQYIKNINKIVNEIKTLKRLNENYLSFSGKTHAENRVSFSCLETAMQMRTESVLIKGI